MAFDLEQAVRDAVPGAVVNVPPGSYAVNLLLEKPVTLVAMGQVILDGTRQGPVVRVRTTGTVKLGGLTLVGGRTPLAGGGVALLEGELELLQCTLRFNEAPVGGGGALYVRAGTARVSQCRFEGNTGRLGGGVLVDGDGRLELRDSLLAQNAALEGGGLALKEAGAATVVACTFADNKAVGDTAQGSALSLAGTSTRAPSLSLSQCIVAERASGPVTVFNFPAHPGQFSATRTLFPEWVQQPGEGNLFAAPGFLGSGSEPYFLAPSSPAVGAGDPEAFDARQRDVLGRNRVQGAGRPDLGAFALGR